MCVVAVLWARIAWRVPLHTLSRATRDWRACLLPASVSGQSRGRVRPLEYRTLSWLFHDALLPAIACFPNIVKYAAHVVRAVECTMFVAALAGITRVVYIHLCVFMRKVQRKHCGFLSWQISPAFPGCAARSSLLPPTPGAHWARGSLARGSLARGSLARGSLARGSLARGSLARGSPARGSLARGSLARGSLARGSPAKGSPARESPAKGSPAKGSPAKGSPARESPAKGRLARGRRWDEEPVHAHSHQTCGLPRCGAAGISDPCIWYAVTATSPPRSTNILPGVCGAGGSGKPESSRVGMPTFHKPIPPVCSTQCLCVMSPAIVLQPKDAQDVNIYTRCSHRDRVV